MPRRGENIYKRKDGRWEGRYIKARNGTKVRYGYVYAKTYAEAKKILAVKRSEITLKKDAASVSVKEDITLNDMTVLWFSDNQGNLKASTLSKYRNLLYSYILPNIGMNKLCDLDYETLSDFCTMLLVSGGLRQQGLSPKTVSDTLTIIKSVLKYAERRKYSVDLTALDVSVKVKTTPLRILSVPEEQSLITYLKKKNTLIGRGILLSMFTGIRLGELCALTWRDISLEQHTLHVHQTMQRIQTNDSPQKTKVMITKPKSQCSVRDIPLSRAIAALFPEPAAAEAYILTDRADQYIEPRTMQNHFKRILKEVGMEDVHFHTLRHTFATRCIEAGFDIKSLSEILGHASVSITLNRYVHPSMELKQKNMEKLSDLFSVK